MCTHTSQPTHRSRSISQKLCKFWNWSYCCTFTMQSTGQTSRQASQPVQLSALMTASSLGSFFRGPCLAIVGSLGSWCWGLRPGPCGGLVCCRKRRGATERSLSNHRKKSAGSQLPDREIGRASRIQRDVLALAGQGEDCLGHGFPVEGPAQCVGVDRPVDRLVAAAARGGPRGCELAIRCVERGRVAGV